MPDYSNTLRLEKDVRYRIIENEAVVLKQSVAEVLTINASGCLLLDLLKDGASPSSMVEELVANYEVSPEIAQADTETFLQSMQEAGLLAIA